MEDAVTEKCSSVGVENQEVKSSESAENFQKFIYELFENNGVINDLRAYLRGHIVEVLRNAQTGDLPACKKHFTQRLELPFQALNILIVEYLLRMEFSYSLSVFISEIPLANMVFGYARSMMTTQRDTALKFANEDIWSILNYLGIKCDSDHALHIIEMYEGDRNPPLLLCILQCTPMYKEAIGIKHESSQESIISNDKDVETLEKTKSYQIQNCKHYVHCKSCHDKIVRVRERYRKKKQDLTETMNEFNVNSQNVETVLKNIDVTERNIMHEMFHQLKTVYEAEVEMMKTEEQTRVKRCLAANALQLQKKNEEMEERYKIRSDELERSAEKKKRFLWGLAQALRDQHQHMTRAMNDVKEETYRLAAKEDNLKSQITEAEETLRQRGEDLRTQISNELIILEEHLESMKKERDSINRERSELEYIKNASNRNNLTQNEDLKNHYDLLKNEFLIFKKYLETAKLEPKCVIERGTITDVADVTSKIHVILNNGQDLERRSDDRIKPQQLINDLKKQKNVNFSEHNTSEVKRSRSVSHSRSSSDGGDACVQQDDDLQQLQQENERLREFARQQRNHIDELTSTQARLQAQLAWRPEPRPRTAPATLPQHHLQSLNPIASTTNLSNGWRKGAGEELSFIANTQPRIVVPGDTIPFIGVVQTNRHVDNRRYLINQWRALRRRISPISSTKRQPVHNFIERPATANPGVRINVAEENENSNENLEPNPEVTFNFTREQYNQQRPKTSVTEVKTREKSPKSVLREAKNKLKTNPHTKDPIPREKSPNTVLREAKLRLRKLEIEAEAVEKSYLDFRNKREAMRSAGIMDEIDLKGQRSSHRMYENPIESTSKDYKLPQTSVTSDFDNYIQEYCVKYDIGGTHFKNKNAAYYQTSPMPRAYSESPKECKYNYLETPLSEFRKNYTSRPDNIKDLPNDSAKYTRSPIKTPQYSESHNRPIVKNSTPERASRPISPMQKSIDHSILNIVASPDNANPAECLIARSIRNHSIMKNIENPENKSPTKSIIIQSIKDHSIILKTTESLESSSRVRSPTLMSIKDNSESSGTLSPKLIRENSEYKSRSQIDSPERSDSNITGIRKQVIINAKHDKVKELQILEQNIKKIYNLPEQSNLSNGSDELKCLSDHSNVLNYETTAVEKGEIICNKEIKEETERNLLRIEVENVSQVNDAQICESHKSQDILFIVESSIDGNNIDNVISDVESDKEKLSTKMTIIVSPKRSRTNKFQKASFSEKSKSESGEKSDKIGEDDVLNHIYLGSPVHISSIQMQLELSNVKDNALSELEQNEDPDYPDDFSADVDNYHSHSEYENQSPISMAKTYEEDNFWDS